ncbi:hypothetical protein HDU67_009224 [Dinochytrium kinnereticum]|nr:hypothetical protein HDU67_009224 [Dinochytrium kinnereticum]
MGRGRRERQDHAVIKEHYHDERHQVVSRDGQRRPWLSLLARWTYDDCITCRLYSFDEKSHWAKTSVSANVHVVDDGIPYVLPITSWDLLSQSIVVHIYGSGCFDDVDKIREKTVRTYEPYQFQYFVKVLDDPSGKECVRATKQMAKHQIIGMYEGRIEYHMEQKASIFHRLNIEKKNVELGISNVKIREAVMKEAGFLYSTNYDIESGTLTNELVVNGSVSNGIYSWITKIRDARDALEDVGAANADPFAHANVELVVMNIMDCTELKDHKIVSNTVSNATANLKALTPDLQSISTKLTHSISALISLLDPLFPEPHRHQRLLNALCGSALRGVEASKAVGDDAAKEQKRKVGMGAFKEVRLGEELVKGFLKAEERVGRELEKGVVEMVDDFVRGGKVGSGGNGKRLLDQFYGSFEEARTFSERKEALVSTLIPSKAPSPRVNYFTGSKSILQSQAKEPLRLKIPSRPNDPSNPNPSRSNASLPTLNLLPNGGDKFPSPSPSSFSSASHTSASSDPVFKPSKSNGRPHPLPSNPTTTLHRRLGSSRVNGKAGKEKSDQVEDDIEDEDFFDVKDVTVTNGGVEDEEVEVPLVNNRKRRRGGHLQERKDKKVDQKFLGAISKEAKKSAPSNVKSTSKDSVALPSKSSKGKEKAQPSKPKRKTSPPPTSGETTIPPINAKKSASPPASPILELSFDSSDVEADDSLYISLSSPIHLGTQAILFQNHQGYDITFEEAVEDFFDQYVRPTTASTAATRWPDLVKERVEMFMGALARGCKRLYGETFCGGSGEGLIECAVLVVAAVWVMFLGGEGVELGGILEKAEGKSISRLSKLCRGLIRDKDRGIDVIFPSWNRYITTDLLNAQDPHFFLTWSTAVRSTYEMFRSKVNRIFSPWPSRNRTLMDKVRFITFATGEIWEGDDEDLEKSLRSFFRKVKFFGEGEIVEEGVISVPPEIANDPVAIEVLKNEWLDPHLAISRVFWVDPILMGGLETAVSER